MQKYIVIGKPKKMFGGACHPRKALPYYKLSPTKQILTKLFGSLNHWNFHYFDQIPLYFLHDYNKVKRI